MTDTNETVAAPQEQSPKKFDFHNVEALRLYMLLTVESMVNILGTTRVSYYNWMKNGIKRKKTEDHVRKMMRLLGAAVSNHNWPYDAVYIAKQPERLRMLKELLISLDKEPAT